MIDYTCDIDLIAVICIIHKLYIVLMYVLVKNFIQLLLIIFDWVINCKGHSLKE